MFIKLNSLDKLSVIYLDLTDLRFSWKLGASQKTACQRRGFYQKKRFYKLPIGQDSSLDRTVKFLIKSVHEVHI